MEVNRLQGRCKHAWLHCSLELGVDHVWCCVSTLVQTLASWRRRQQDTLRIAQTLKSTLCHRSPLPFELKVGCV